MNQSQKSEPTEEEVLRVLQEFRSPAEAYSEVKKRYGEGNGIFVKQVALKHNIWKRRNQSESAAATASSASEASAASASNVASTSASSSVPVEDHSVEPFAKRLKAFNDAVVMLKRVGVQFDVIKLARMMGFEEISDLLKPEPNPTSHAPNAGTSAPGQEALVNPILGDVNSLVRSIIHLKVILPVINQLTGEGGLLGSPGGQKLDARELERIIEGQLRRIQGDPEVKALKEMFTKLQHEMQLKPDPEIEALKQTIAKQEEDRRLQQFIGNRPSPETEILKFQLDQLKQNQDKSTQVEMIDKVISATQGSNTNVSDMFTKFQSQLQENQRMLEQQRMAHDQELRTLQAQQNQIYVDRLRTLEGQILDMTKGQSGNPFEMYNTISTLIQKEVDRFKGSPKEGEGAVNLIDNLTKNAPAIIKEFAPILTAKQAPAPQPQMIMPGMPGVTRMVSAPMQMPQPQPVTQSTVTGQCPHCSQNVTIPEFTEPVPCPNCGQAIRPQVTAPEMRQPQIITPQPVPAPIPVQPVAQPIMPQPVALGRYPFGVEEWVDPKTGQIQLKRDPNAPMIA